MEKSVLFVYNCTTLILLQEEPTKIRNMKDLYMYTDKNDLKATIVIDNRVSTEVHMILMLWYKVYGIQALVLGSLDSQCTLSQ